ncbi:X-ray repair cross-complementing protein 5-like isoform X2 [Actinia tenebrosa]|nr:X-ray repair cross-complementing protein 5-like isoform X2 [Actinia tenebrosa]
MDLLRERTRGKKVEKKIYLFTDLGSPFGKDQLDLIINGLKEMEAEFILVGPDLYDDDDDNSDNARGEDTNGNQPSTSRGNGTHPPRKPKTPQQLAGEECIKHVLEEVDGQTYSFSCVLPMLSFFECRRIKQTTVFRGPLEIGTTLKINVYAYNRVREEKLASWKKLSAISQASANPDSMEVKMERSYHLNDEDQTEVQKDDVAQGYRYGKTIVPLTKIDKDSMKLTTEKCLSVLGFTSLDNIKRYQFIGENVVAFTAQPEDVHAGVALSAFINGMYESDTVAIVRYCFRKNAAPKLGFLSPHIKKDYECLLFTALPFMEDIRQFGFGSLDANKKLVPSDEQLQAIDNLVTAMDLTKAIRHENGDYEEALKPKCTFNPTRQRVFQCIQHRALNPDDHDLPELEPVIASYIEPSPEFKAKCSTQCLKVKDLFRLEKIEKKKTQQAAENIFKASVDNDLTTEPAAKRQRTEDAADETDFSMAAQAKGKVTEVGTVEPVADFKELISRKDVDQFDEAAKQMKDRIVQLIMDSFGDQFYPKAMDCVVALRQESIKAGEAEMFNDFLRDLKSKIFNQRGHGFWLRLVKDHLTLINKDESPDSSLTKDDATKFLDEVTTEEVEEPQEEEMDDADDLLAMMD